jgi:hypothetical protein
MLRVEGPGIVNFLPMTTLDFFSDSGLIQCFRGEGAGNISYGLSPPLSASPPLSPSWSLSGWLVMSAPRQQRCQFWQMAILGILDSLGVVLYIHLFINAPSRGAKRRFLCFPVLSCTFLYFPSAQHNFAWFRGAGIDGKDKRAEQTPREVVGNSCDLHRESSPQHDRRAKERAKERAIRSTVQYSTVQYRTVQTTVTVPSESHNDCRARSSSLDGVAERPCSGVPPSTHFKQRFPSAVSEPLSLEIFPPPKRSRLEEHPRTEPGRGVLRPALCILMF